MAGEDPTLLRPQVPLAGYTTWKVGAPPNGLLSQQTSSSSAWMAWAQQRQMPWRVIGAGSNLLNQRRRFARSHPLSTQIAGDVGGCDHRHGGGPGR